MALKHAEPGQPVNLSTAGEGAHRAALVKSDEFEAIVLRLAAGETLPSHQVSGSLTLQCLAGSADLEVGGVNHRLEERSWVFLEGGAQHGLRAVEDCELLLTIVLR